MEGAWNSMKSTPHLQNGMMVMTKCKGAGGAIVLDAYIWKLVQCLIVVMQ